ncbi:hypothetical protein FHY12_002932 [Xanthomonas arboricola]|uniref:hypothetical protein n=1 Tax=Xanthomonas euroxanthea TaxID=2259622 RepID=UPI00141BC8C3|nr:hypothetical protein [Xanthomonas euroxanthea]MBB5766365.1 hypothetical protein [Xanthomonas euroxanthea]NIK40607.1 hypothetical protein [Xanthomonas euroxanthea]
MAASMPPHGPAIDEDTAPERWSVAGSKPVLLWNAEEFEIALFNACLLLGFD